MKKLIIGISLLALLLIPIDVFAGKVKGYYKKNGTYVSPHYRSKPDGSKGNNYSTKGNVNPYTGKKGYVSPYGN